MLVFNCRNWPEFSLGLFTTEKHSIRAGSDHALASGGPCASLHFSHIHIVL